MKLSRYRLSGAIHRSGMGATFCVRWLVVASSRADAQAAREIHNRIVVPLGLGAICSTKADWTGSMAMRLFHAATRHTIANTTNAPDQMRAWFDSASFGSTRK